MSYSHADNLVGGGPQRDEPTPPADRPETTAAAKPGEGLPVPADWFARPELVQVLADHDIGALYRWLHAAGVPQRRIAALTGTTQSQVADIITGRQR